MKCVIVYFQLVNFISMLGCYTKCVAKRYTLRPSQRAQHSIQSHEQRQPFFIPSKLSAIYID